MVVIGGGKKKGKLQVGSTKSIKEVVNKHEADLAKRMGGYRRPASGALSGMKGDLTAGNFLLDSKQTKNNSIMIAGKDLVKISREAREDGKLPGLVVKIEGIATTVSPEWVMIPIEVFTELMENSPKSS